MRKHQGGGTFDPDTGTATAAELVVMIVPQGDGTFRIAFVCAVPLEDQIRIGRGHAGLRTRLGCVDR